MQFAVAAGIGCLAVMLAVPSSVHGQGRDGFGRALVDFINAVNDGDRPAVITAVDAMAAALADWDAAIARAEAGMARDITAAQPAVAARMRATLGLLYLERGRSGEAAAQFDLAAKLPGVPGEVHVLRGWALQSAGRRAEAAAAFARAHAAAPADPGSAYLALHHDRGGAIDGVRPKTVAAVLAAEGALFGGGAGPLFSVPALLDDSAAAEPILPPARFASGFALLRQGKYGEALVELRAAAADTSWGDERAELARTESLIAAGAFEDAERALTGLIARLPEAGRAYWLLGRLYQRLNREAEALARFERAAAMNPIAGAAPLHVIVGQLHENQFNPEQAERALVRAIDADPNHAPAHRELAEALVGLDRLDEAHVEFVVALRLDASDAVAWTGLGQVHAAQDRLDAAVSAFRRAVALDARHKEAHYGLARALTRLGRVEEGHRELEVFERLQAEAMAEERRRYEENLQRIEQLRERSAGSQR